MKKTYLTPAIRLRRSHMEPLLDVNSVHNEQGDGTIRSKEGDFDDDAWKAKPHTVWE